MRIVLSIALASDRVTHAAVTWQSSGCWPRGWLTNQTMVVGAGTRPTSSHNNQTALSDPCMTWLSVPGLTCKIMAACVSEYPITRTNHLALQAIKNVQGKRFFGGIAIGTFHIVKANLEVPCRTCDSTSGFGAHGFQGWKALNRFPGSDEFVPHLTRFSFRAVSGAEKPR